MTIPNDERRVELTAKVAVLDERSVTVQRQLDRIESAFINHAEDERGVMADITKSMSAIDEKIQLKIDSEVGPIKVSLNNANAQISKFTTTIGVLSTILTAVFSLIVIFKDHILSLFH